MLITIDALLCNEHNDKFREAYWTYYDTKGMTYDENCSIEDCPAGADFEVYITLDSLTSNELFNTLVESTSLDRMGVV